LAGKFVEFLRGKDSQEVLEASHLRGVEAEK